MGWSLLDSLQNECDELDSLLAEMQDWRNDRKQNMATEAWYYTACRALGSVGQVIALKLQFKSWERLRMCLRDEEEDACQPLQEQIYHLLEKNGKSRANWDMCRPVCLESSYDMDSECFSAFIEDFKHTPYPADAAIYVPDLLHLLELGDKGNAIQI